MNATRGPRKPEQQLRRELVQFAHLCYERGLLVGFDGNLSARIDDDFVLCTRANCHKGLLTEDDLLIVTLAGKKVRGNGAPTSELGMHLACYKARPDVQAVVHAHPPICIAFTVAGLTMARCVLPEVVLTMGVIPTLSYETTGTTDLAALVGEAVREHDAVLLDHHGAVALGDSLLAAFCKLETMEHTAKIMKAARDLGGIIDLPPAESAHLRKLGLSRYGGPPAARARVGEPFADLPLACQACSGCGNPTAKGLGAKAPFSVARLSSAAG